VLLQTQHSVTCAY